MKDSKDAANQSKSDDKEKFFFAGKISDKGDKSTSKKDEASDQDEGSLAFFLHDTGSELSSSNSEDDEIVQASYLLEKAKSEFNEKFTKVAAKAKAAKSIASDADWGINKEKYGL